MITKKNLSIFTLIFLGLFAVNQKTLGQNCLTVTGQTNVLCNLSQTYTVNVSSAIALTITLVGGTFTAQPTGSCNFPFTITPPPPAIPTTTLTLTSTNLSCNFTIPVTWNSSGTRTLTAVSTGSCPRTVVKTITSVPPTCFITGPIGQVCTNMTSGFYMSNSTGLYGAHQWTATSTGAPLTVQTPTSGSTNITGFTPNNMYSLTHYLFCNPLSTSYTAYCSATVLTIRNCTGGLKAPDDDGEIDTDMDVVQLNDEDKVIVFGDDDSLDDDNQHVILAKNEPAEASLYPNPVQQGARLFFLIPESVKETCSVRVLDMQGKVLDSFDQSNGVRELETSNYPAGMYFINYTINGKNQTRKFSIVQ